MVPPLPRSYAGRAALVALAALFALVLCYLSASAQSTPIPRIITDADFVEPAPGPLPLYDPSLASKIEDAFVWLVEKKGANEGHPIIGDPLHRAAVREAGLAAGSRYDLPPDLLWSICYRESVFTLDRVGTRGEIGMMQVGAKGRAYCAEACGTNTTAAEQIACGACWLDAGRTWCGGDLRRGLTAYAGGKCHAKTAGVVRAVYLRYRVWRKLRSLVYGPEEPTIAAGPLGGGAFARGMP